MNVIRLGVCAPIEHILAAERAGFDYLEGNLCRCSGYESHIRAAVRYFQDKREVK